MIVIGIMGIIMTMGVPMVWKVWHRAPMAQALRNVTQGCLDARQAAILKGQPVELVFHPREGRLEVVASPAPAAASPSPHPADARPQSSVSTPHHSDTSGQIPDHVRITALGINLLDCTDLDSARVRFFPNGTCDEMLLILDSDRGEQRGVSLEVTTAVAEILSDRELTVLLQRLKR